jgi:hypothetical protein
MDVLGRTDALTYLLTLPGRARTAFVAQGSPLRTGGGAQTWLERLKWGFFPHFATE